jgi:hypothetical protein
VATDADLPFLDRAFQYYVAARSAALAKLQPVDGSLFHHAIEMFLKARLSQKFSLKQLQDKFGHDLLTLWDAFKAEFPSISLEQFDDTIEALAQFERIRYPDAIIAEGAQFITSWEKSSVPTGIVSGGEAAPPPRYEINIADIDRLIAKILKICSRNPVFFTSRLNDYAQDAIARHNPVAQTLLKPKGGQNST